MCEVNQHEHRHEHDHDDHGHHHHHHAHGEAAPGKNRDQKILIYMIDHNAEHAREMRELAERLRQAGNEEAAGLIDGAADGFEAANKGLQKALEKM